MNGLKSDNTDRVAAPSGMGNCIFFHMTSQRPYWCSKNNEMASILVYQGNPVGVEIFSYVNTFFCSNEYTYLPITRVKTLYYTLDITLLFNVQYRDFRPPPCYELGIMDATWKIITENACVSFIRYSNA